MKNRKIPHTFVIVFIIIVIAAALTWFIRPGLYVKEVVDGQEVMHFYYQDELPESCRQQFKAEPQTWQLFSAFYEGFVKQSNIIVFILIIGGAFWIMNQSKAIDTGIYAFLRFTRRLERHKYIKRLGVHNIIIVMVMILFSLFGSVFGLSEEAIAFTLIVIPLAISMGFDSITGVCMVYMAAHIGFAGAMLNPFTIGIAQGLAEIPLFSGIGYRIFCWAILTIIGIIFVLIYANRIKKNPTSSIMYEADAYWRRQENSEQEKVVYYTPRSAWWVYTAVSIILIIIAILLPISTIRIGNSAMDLHLLPLGAILFVIVGFFSLKKSVHYFILLLLFSTIYYLITGVLGYSWYIMEIASLFLFMGIASGLAFGKGPSEIAKLFVEGMSDILSAAIIVGLAGGIVIVLQNGGIIDTILYGLSKSMRNMGSIASVEIMYFIQTIINVAIPSGSAKAAITIPIMAPFSDLINVSRQATVMAFQFGDGFTNMLTPTSGVLIATLGVARIPYAKWVRFAWKFILFLIVLGALLLIPTAVIPLSGF